MSGQNTLITCANDNEIKRPSGILISRQFYRDKSAQGSGVYKAMDENGNIEIIGGPGVSINVITNDTIEGNGTALNPLKLKYKSYVALLTQTDVNAPTAVVLENELTGNITFNYVDVGIYDIIISDNSFLSNKTFVLKGSGNGNDLGFLPYRKSNSAIRILTFSDFEITSANDILRSAPIEIRIYN